MTKVTGIRIRYLRVADLPSIEGFEHPEVQNPKDIRPLYWARGMPYELYDDFGMLREAVETVSRKGGACCNPFESYAIAQEKNYRIVGFAVTGGLYIYTRLEGRNVLAPDVHYAYVHPDYRRMGIGTAMVEKLLQHHEFLMMAPVSLLGKKLVKSLTKTYGHPESAASVILRRQKN